MAASLDADTLRLAIHALDELLPVRRRAELPRALINCARRAIRCDGVDLAFYLAGDETRPEPAGKARMHVIATFVAEAAGYRLAGHALDGIGLPRRRSTIAATGELPVSEEAPYQLGFNVGGLSDAVYVALTRTDHDFDDTEVAVASLLRPRMTATLMRTADPSNRQVIDLGTLTAREHVVLALAADGLIDRAIATRLGVSERTVQKHLQSIYTKLRAPNRTVAVLRWDRQRER